MFEVQSPGRVGIIGNPSDGYGGAVLSCAIKNKAMVSIEPANQLVLKNQTDFMVFRRQDDFKIQGDNFDIPRVVLGYFNLYDLKAKITIESDIPEKAGLAGSTAVLSAFARAILSYSGKQYNKYHFAELIRYLELNYLGCQCGYQDAYMTTFGGLNYLDFRGKEYYRELVDEPYATVEPLQKICRDLPFIIAYSGEKHDSGKFHHPLRERWMNKDKKVIKAYREITALCQEGKKALLSRDWQWLARLINENYIIQESLAPSGRANNEMIKAAMENGALCAKLAGAGNGGSVIVLTLDPAKTKEALVRSGAKGFIKLDPDSPGLNVKTYLNAVE